VNRVSIRAVHISLLLAACSDVQSVQLGELAGSSAGASSGVQDAAASPPTLATRHDAGTANAPDPTTPDPSQPLAADAGAISLDARVDDGDVDDDDDEDSEESPEPERTRDDEDAGEPSDD
jgi:hypothetical protein